MTRQIVCFVALLLLGGSLGASTDDSARDTFTCRSELCRGAAFCEGDYYERIGCRMRCLAKTSDGVALTGGCSCWPPPERVE